MRTIVALSLFAALSAGCEPVHEYPPQDEALLVGALADDRFVAWEDGQEVDWVYGSQGGTMIQPVLSLDAEAAGYASEAQLTLSNAPDPAFPGAGGELDSFSGGTENISLEQQGAVLLSEPIDDQLGWDDPSGLRMILSATVSGDGFELSKSLALRMPGDPPANPECQDLPTLGSGCVYRLIAGTGTVTSIASGSGAPNCDERLAVEFDFAPQEPSWATCYQGGEAGSLQTEDGQDLTSACIDALGLEVGAEFAVEYGHAIAGTCTPWMWIASRALEGCAGICP
jgi:hypothetical protein